MSDGRIDDLLLGKANEDAGWKVRIFDPDVAQLNTDSEAVQR